MAHFMRKQEMNPVLLKYAKYCPVFFVMILQAASECNEEAIQSVLKQIQQSRASLGCYPTALSDAPKY